jgi:hypothetical protein
MRTKLTVPRSAAAAVVTSAHLEDVLGPHVLHAAEAHLVLAWCKSYRGWNVISADVALFITLLEALLHYLG